MQNRFLQFFLDFFVMFLPIILVVLIGMNLISPQPNASDWYLSTILGVALAIWLMTWRIRTAVHATLTVLRNQQPFSIELVLRADIPTRIQPFYSLRNRKVQSTHIAYGGTKHKYDARQNDFAAPLYTSDRHIPFERIVHVETDIDKDWVRRMMSVSKNENYHIHILEKPVAVPYPNFLIAEDETHRKTLFMSFRGAWGGDRTFAFVTSNIDLIDGLQSHFAKIFNDLPTAQECLDRWNVSQKLEGGTK